jgi:negative regulator of flagellin synthesis FlgM
MVDSVKSAISRMETVKMRRADAAGSQASATAPKPSGKTDSDSVELKSAEMAAVARDMASVAPVDMDKVNRIKSAIKEGKYPIDIDKVSDALMDAYREMKT